MWRGPAGILGRILESATGRLGELRGRRSELERAAAAAPAPPPFASALVNASVAIIAEVKRSSPSRGAIAPHLDAARQAGAYEAGGAAAVSVLTEPNHFGGAPADLLEARHGTLLPLLRKDFIVDELQLLEARALGASAALLIARALAPARLAALVAAADTLGVEPMVEVRTEEELEAALAAGARVIGVNNRDLETLAIDQAVSARLLPLIPGGRVAVYESGVHGRHDVERAADFGADAVLVGSAVSAAPDAASAVRALTGVPRGGRR